MRILQNTIWIGACAVALCVPSVRAQQEQQPQQPQQPGDQQAPAQASGPIPAYRSPLASAAGNNDADEGAQELTPDTTSLSGAQNLTLGMPTVRSYWQPHFDFSLTANSNPIETANSPGWGAWASISGGIDIHRISGSNQMALSYTSGGEFTNYSGVKNGVEQGLSFSDKFGFRRWSLAFFDSLSYLPATSFGFGGLSGNAISSGSSSGLGSTFTNGQSLLTGYGQNIGNSFATEVDTFLTPRTSLTFVGGYSLLHYFDSDLLDYGNYNFRAGYNYQMTRNDTLAAFYTYGGFRYGNFDQSIDSHTVQVSYGRRVTGHLAFQVAAGPQIVISRIPVEGNSGATGGGTATVTNSTQLFWSLTTALQWQLNRTSMGLTYNHGVGGGSGVLAGTESDVVAGSVTRQISRTFSNGLSAGFSRSKGVAITSETAASQTYDYWFAGASLTHPIGRTLGLTFSYQMQYQASDASFCFGPTCGTSVIGHFISVGVGWHERPLLF